MHITGCVERSHVRAHQPSKFPARVSELQFLIAFRHFEGDRTPRIMGKSKKGQDYVDFVYEQFPPSLWHSK